MIEIKIIDAPNKADVNIPNEKFQEFGRIIPSYDGKKRTWTYELLRFAPENVTETCFPEENYDFDSMQDSVFLGAYDGDKCVGLAILQPGFFKYMYLYDLKVNKEYRRQHIGRLLIQKSKETAKQKGYSGFILRGRTTTPVLACFILNRAFI